METRSASNRRRVKDGPLIPPLHLPTDIVGKLLQWFDIPSLLLLAGCNSALRREILSAESPHKKDLWSTIDFGTVPGNLARKLTDRCLKALLRDCHAREITTVLKLEGCTQLRGLGLEPLRGSCVLREADMRLSPALGLTTAPALSVLSSMPPFAPVPTNSKHIGLSLVKFPTQNLEARNYFERFEARVADWMRLFHDAFRRKAIEHKLCCGHCNEVISAKWSEEDLDWVMNTSYCEVCKKHTCHGDESNCPSTEACERCMRQTCQPYGDAQQGKCSVQDIIWDCALCQFRLCEYCRVGGACCSNDHCVAFYCDENGCADLLAYCDVCEEPFCPDCYERLTHCDTCDENFCSDCTHECASDVESVGSDVQYFTRSERRQVRNQYGDYANK